MLKKGCETARETAAATLDDVRKAMKINYFDDAELIAEHVENSGEQQTVESTNIQYTQGYYFSKPLPYQNLEQKKKD